MTEQQNNSTRIYIIRHGETDANVAGRFEGQGGDSPLNGSGHLQAKSLAARFDDMGISAIYASTLHRAKQTAEYTATRQACPLVIDAAINEIDIGVWEGLTLEEISIEFPELYRQWSEDYTSVYVPGSETMTELSDRSLGFIRDISDKHKGETVIIFTHGGPIKCILGSVLAMPLDQCMHLDIYNTGVSNVEKTGMKFELNFMNDISHLDGLEPLTM